MHLIEMATKNIKETVIAACLILIIHSIHKADSLNCFEQAGPHEDITRIDCQMHNACQKISDSKTKSTVKKNCFLSPGSNDTCFVNDSGEEVCWCHTDFCNKASLSTIAFHHWISALILPLIAYYLVVTWKKTLSYLLFAAYLNPRGY